MAVELPLGAESIVLNSGIMLGTPVVRGTQSRIEMILRHLAHNPTRAGCSPLTTSCPSSMVRRCWRMPR